MDKDKLYDDYLKRNRKTFVSFDSVETKGKEYKLVFWGKDIADNDIWIKLDIRHNKLVNSVSCGEEFTLEELHLFDSNVYYEIYIKDGYSNKKINLYDWL